METSSFEVLKIGEFLAVTSQENFWDFVKEEYNKIEAVIHQGTAIAFSRSGNISRNRFPDVPCWDHSRVIITSHGNVTHDYGDWRASRIIITRKDSPSTYIHASFVDGFEEEKKFIAAAGPMQRTAGDWWKMVSEQGSQVIVMLTDTHVGFQELCYGYWVHDEGYEVAFGRYIIRTLEIENSTLIKTRLQLIDITTGASKEIFHFWYTGWSDKKVPTNLRDFLTLLAQVNLKQTELKKTAADNKEPQLGPIIVHSSAGAGRTGTFCAIDNAVTQFNQQNKVSIPQAVLKVRGQRHSSVGSPEQYAFCYRALEHVVLLEASQKWDQLVLSS